MKKLLFISTILLFSNLNAYVQPTQYGMEPQNMYAQYDLGLKYKYLHPNSQNLYRAFRLLHKSASQGHVLAQYEFALMFHYGHGVKQNAELARLWLTRAAKKGHPQAQEILYLFYSAKRPNYYQHVISRYNTNFRTYR